MLVPDLFKMCTRKNLTVAQALDCQRWTQHLKGDLPHSAIIQAVQLWELVQFTQLQLGTPDSVSWRWTADGAYSASSAYAIQFEGAKRTGFQKTVWYSDALIKCRIFAWLAVQGRCRTADVLTRCGLPHNDSCALCLSSPETAAHLLAVCPMTMQLWCTVLQLTNLPPCFLPEQTQTLKYLALHHAAAHASTQAEKLDSSGSIGLVDDVEGTQYTDFPGACEQPQRHHSKDRRRSCTMACCRTY